MTTRSEMAAAEAVSKDAWIVVAIGLGGSLALGAIVGRGALAPIRTVGWAALFALVLVLAISPAAAVAGRLDRARAARALTRARRRLGVGAFGLASGHAALAAVEHVGIEAALAVDRYRHGALALGLLLPLAITSSDAVNRALGLRAWGALHRAVYLATALALLHATRAPFASVVVVLGAAAAVALLLVARPLLARRSKVG